MPNDQRAAYLFETVEDRRAAIESARGFVDEGDWQRSHLIANDPEVIRHRATFNLIRSYVPDEQDIIKPLAAMKPRQLDFDPHRFVYPAFVTYLSGAAIAIGAATGFITLSPNIEFYFLHPWEFGKMYIAGRLMVVLFSLSTILLTWRLGRAMYSDRAGGLAALLLAVTPIWAIDTHYLKVDIPGTFWIILSIYASWRYTESRALRTLALAGIFAGLAAGSKYNFGIIILTPIAALILGRQKIVLGFGVLFATSLLAFLAVNPYIVLSFDEFSKDFHHAFGVVAGAGPKGPDTSALFYPLHVLPASLGIPLFLAVVAGLVFAALKPGRREILLISFILPYAFFLQMTFYKLSSYLLPFLPLFALLAAAPLVETRRRLPIAAIVVVGSLIFAVAEVSIFSKPNTRDRAAEWIQKNIPAGSSIGLMATPIAFHTPPISASRYTLAIPPSDTANFIVVSDYWMREYRLRGASFPAGEIIQSIEDGPYTVAAIIEERPLWRPRLLPQDWVHPAPTIWIYRRT